jgi:hypothetical protein
VVLFCHVTTHVQGDKYDGLLREKGGTGFPTLAFMDEAGEVLAKQPGAERTVPAFSGTLAKVTELRALERQTPVAVADIALLRIDLGAITSLEAARKALAPAGKLSEPQQKRADASLLKLEASELVAGRAQARLRRRRGRDIRRLVRGGQGAGR